MRLLSAVKGFARRWARRFASPPEFRPYVVPFELHAHAFRVWIADEVGRQWYGDP